MENVYLALIVAVPAMLSPILMSWINNRHRRQEKLEDYARQDQVSLRAEEAAKKVATVASQLLETNRKVAESSHKQMDQLKEIHVLVNSDKTVAFEQKLVLVRQALVSLLEIIDLKRQLNIQPTDSALLEVSLANGRIKELEDILVDRAKQTELAKQIVENNSSASKSSADSLRRIADAADGKVGGPQEITDPAASSADSLGRIADAAEVKVEVATGVSS